MYNSLISSLDNSLLRQRMARLEDKVRELEFSTKDEFQAELYSLVNALISQGNSEQTLLPVQAESPAVPGTLNDNLNLLNQEAADLLSYLLEVQDSSARLVNLAAMTHGSVRNNIRLRRYHSSATHWQEVFLDNSQIGSSQASIENGPGIASLPVLETTEVVANNISLGPASSGSIKSGALSNLLDGKLDTILDWSGDSLELVFDFSSAVVLNRIHMELAEYSGLLVTKMTATLGASYSADILAELGQTELLADISSSKLFGEVLLDFAPKKITRLSIVFQDRAGESRIALRNIGLWARTFQTSAKITSTTVPLSGSLKFTTSELSTGPLTNILHQVSEDGQNFRVIQPGDVVATTGPFFYRCTLNRNESRFDNSLPLVEKPGSDPKTNSDYTVSGSSTMNLGSGVVLRNIRFSSVTGPIKLEETPLPGTLVVQEGSTILTENQYTFADNVLSFSGPKVTVSIQYQAGESDSGSLAERKPYYSPYLYSVSFEKV